MNNKRKTFFFDFSTLEDYTDRIPEKSVQASFLDFLTLEDYTDRISRNVGTGFLLGLLDP
jgi:hypothetical protein